MIGWLKTLMHAVLVLVTVGIAIVLMPVLWVVTYASYWHAWRKGLDAVVTNEGLRIFSRSRGPLLELPWREIKAIRVAFRPPINYAVICLHSGEELHQ